MAVQKRLPTKKSILSRGKAMTLGASHIFDMGSTLTIPQKTMYLVNINKRKRNIVITNNQTKKIYKDWVAAGNDIRQAVKPLTGKINTNRRLYIGLPE